MAFNTNERLQEAFSLALEDRSRGWQDLVSNSNVLLLTLKERNAWKPFSGPTIRERVVYNESGNYTRYTGYEFINNSPAELINDAEWEFKQVALGVTLSGTDILKNSGRNQLKDIMRTHIELGETEMMDRFNEDMHSDGTADGGKQIGGLQQAIPTDPTTGTYAGISRADNAIWRTGIWDIDSDFTGQTQLTSANVYNMFLKVMINQSRGKRGPKLILATEKHFTAFTESLVSIQRVTKESRMATLGFPAVAFAGAGKTVEVVLEGGIGTAMPDDTTYFLEPETLCVRYHPDRNFSKIGGKQMPINQDAYTQMMGWAGNLTMKNPLFNAKLYDSDPAT